MFCAMNADVNSARDPWCQARSKQQLAYSVVQGLELAFTTNNDMLRVCFAWCSSLLLLRAVQACFMMVRVWTHSLRQMRPRHQLSSFHVNGRDIKNNEPAISRTLNYALLYMYIQQNHVMVALAVA